jgi:hypothetical protein
MKYSAGSGVGRSRPSKNKVKMVYTGSSPLASAGGIASNPRELLPDAEMSKEGVKDYVGWEQQVSNSAEPSSSSSSPSEEKIQKPEKLKRARFKDLEESSGEGERGGDGPSSAAPPPPPAAAAVAVRSRNRRLLTRPLKYGMKNRVIDVRFTRNVPRTAMSFLR